MESVSGLNRNHTGRHLYFGYVYVCDYSLLITYISINSTFPIIIYFPSLRHSFSNRPIIPLLAILSRLYNILLTSMASRTIIILLQHLLLTSNNCFAYSSEWITLNHFLSARWKMALGTALWDVSSME